MKEENLNIEFVRQALDRSSDRLGQDTQDKLRMAREQALARFDARVTAPALVFAGVGGNAQSPSRSLYYWLAALLLAASLFGVSAYWQHMVEHENSEVDIAILTDEMPMDVYVD